MNFNLIYWNRISLTFISKNNTLHSVCPVHLTHLMLECYLRIRTELYHYRMHWHLIQRDATPNTKDARDATNIAPKTQNTTRGSIKSSEFTFSATHLAESCTGYPIYTLLSKVTIWFIKFKFHK